MIDLFGREVDEAMPSRGRTLKARVLTRYGPAEVGSGRNCGTCGMSFQRRAGGRSFRKCEILGCSMGPGTDVSRTHVCDDWTGKID